MYSKCGLMRDARQVFDELPDPDVVSWTALILGYNENGESELALKIFESIPSCKPDSRIYVAALSAISSLAEKQKQGGKLEKNNIWLEKGRGIHWRAIGNRCCANIFVENALVDMYGKCGSTAMAKEIFDRMKHRDVVSWNALLQGYVENDENQVALELFHSLESSGSVFMNSRTYVAALSACANLAGKQKVLSKKQRWFSEGKMIHTRAASTGCCNVFVENTMVDLYSKCGSVSEAKLVFDRIPRRDVVSWTALIMGLVNNGREEEALELVSRMDSSGVKRNYATFVAIFTACGNLMALETGRVFHRELGGFGLERNLVVANSLVDFYGKCGSLEEARMVFDSIGEKTIVSWTTLMWGYSLQGDTANVFSLFERMMERRISPDNITFVCVLTACSHAGLTEKGREFFEAMVEKHGIDRELIHYTCMIDLLGRANRLGEAMDMLREMPFEADAVTWTSVLGACRKWNDVELAKAAYESLLRLSGNDAGTYVLMANIAEAAEAAERRRGLKMEGQTFWTDASGRTFRFSDARVLKGLFYQL